MYKWNQMDPSGFIWFHLYAVRVTDLYGSIMTPPKEPTSEFLESTLRTTVLQDHNVLLTFDCTTYTANNLVNKVRSQSINQSNNQCVVDLPSTGLITTLNPLTH